MRPSDRLEFTAAYQYRTRKYYATNPNPFFPLTKDHFHQVSAEVQSRRSSRLGVGAVTTYETRNGNGNFYDYKSFRVTAFVRVVIGTGRGGGPRDDGA